MKKLYISPNITIVLLSHTAMIALSTNVDDLKDSGNTNDAGITEGAVKQESYSVWGDDWSK